MADFLATNGTTVKPTDGGVRLAMSSGWNIAGADVVALREYFQHECDTSLERWRSADQPCMVAYPVPDTSSVRVLNEKTASSGIWSRGDIPADTLEGMGEVARAYFAAHPEPRPWHTAGVGEFWDLTVEGFPEAQDDLWRATGSEFVRVSDVGRVVRTDVRITGGERIWPKRA